MDIDQRIYEAEASQRGSSAIVNIAEQTAKEATDAEVTARVTFSKARYAADEAERVMAEARDTLDAGAVCDARLMKARLAYDMALVAQRKASVEMLEAGSAALTSKIARAATERSIATAVRVADETMVLAKAAEVIARETRRKADAALLAVVTTTKA